MYLLTGPSHAVRLAVSLWSLRKHFQGPVTVYTAHPESHPIGQRLAAETRLGVDHLICDPVAVRRNSAFLTKLVLALRPPYEVTAYFDADTLVAGDISALFDAARDGSFCATQFSNWSTTKRVIRQRIERWRTVRQTIYAAAEFAELLAEARQPHPAVNGGVFAFRRDAPLLRPWHDLARAGWRTFICDEIALQILLHHYPHQLLDCRYNCSPIYGIHGRDVRIWHFHGEKHVSRAEARAIWLPAYEECVQANVAGLTTWAPASDWRLANYLAGNGEAT
jgi:hypothetical protein